MSGTYLKIAELIHKERIGVMTASEKTELEEWLKEDALHRLVYEKLALTAKEYGQYQQISGEKIWKNIERLTIRKRAAFRFRWSGVAAGLTAFLTVGTWFLYKNGADQPVTPVAEIWSYDSIQPGRQKAILQLADGRKIALHKEEIRLKTDMAAIRQSGNYLKYEADSCCAGEKINSLTVPQGGEFSVILSDGTKVWLNAQSRLEYPEVFTGDCRKVRLEGEAYFEVAKNKDKPFIVRLQKADIRVLGTNFNVKAFSEEKRTITTLLEGSVEIAVSGQKVKIKPNQQVCYISGENDLKVTEVDAVDFVAWKEGKFVFRNEPLEYMMETIARWYNIRVFYQNPEVKAIPFSGKMDRYGSVEEVLKMIEQTGKVGFQLSGKGLIVRAK